MAVNGRELPGFYYDPEKKKYFKIEKTHLAPSGSKYSRESVKSIKDSHIKQKRADKSNRLRQKQLAHRCRILRKPLAAGAFLERELGGRSISTLHTAQTDAFVNNIVPSAFTDLARRNRVGISLPRISCFDYDKATGGLLVGVTDNKDIGSLVSVRPSTDLLSSPAPNTIEMRAITAFRSDISSVNISPTRTVVTTSAGSHEPPTIHLTKLLDPSETDCSLPSDSGFSFQFRPPDASTIWASAPNPWDSSGSVENIAIGTSNSVIHLYGQYNWQSQSALKTASDALALSWISKHTLAAGMRNGTVHLWDARSNGKSVRLSHPGPVTGIKSAGNDAQLVVCGLKSSLCMYDLRMPAMGSGFSTFDGLGVEHIAFDHRPANVPSHGPKSRFKNSMRLTTPAIRFQSEQHEYQYPIGFDVDPELRVVLAAGDRGAMSAYSLQTGQKIRRWDMSGFGQGESRSTVKCARFIDDEAGRSTILASIESKVIELGWRGEE